VLPVVELAVPSVVPIPELVRSGGGSFRKLVLSVGCSVEVIFVPSVVPFESFRIVRTALTKHRPTNPYTWSVVTSIV